jgi:methylated-DNA-[protein]-cysteine S-methyltransferase
MTSERCRVSEEQVLAFVTGDMDRNASLALAEHLGECRACRDQATEYTSLLGGLQSCSAEEAVHWHRFETPFGMMNVAATGTGLSRLSWREPDPDAFVRHLGSLYPDRPAIHDAEGLAQAERQLHEYFAGDRSLFELPVDLTRLSGFEQEVLECVRAIPFGDVVPYSEVARRIGRPKAARAVGNALNHNPVAIVVPCHRVVRADGSLGGYGGGVPYKRRLLSLEGTPSLFSN